MKGDDSKIIVDHAIPFITENAKSKKPFIAVIWLHAPHLPVVAGKAHPDLYPDADGFHANYYGCVSAIDDQIGRIRKTLRNLEIADIENLPTPQFAEKVKFAAEHGCSGATIRTDRRDSHCFYNE